MQIGCSAATDPLFNKCGERPAGLGFAEFLNVGPSGVSAGVFRSEAAHRGPEIILSHGAGKQVKDTGTFLISDAAPTAVFLPKGTERFGQSGRVAAQEMGVIASFAPGLRFITIEHETVVICAVAGECLAPVAIAWIDENAIAPP